MLLRMGLQMYLAEFYYSVARLFLSPDKCILQIPVQYLLQKYINMDESYKIYKENLHKCLNTPSKQQKKFQKKVIFLTQIFVDYLYKLYFIKVLFDTNAWKIVSNTSGSWQRYFANEAWIPRRVLRNVSKIPLFPTSIIPTLVWVRAASSCSATSLLSFWLCSEFFPRKSSFSFAACKKRMNNYHYLKRIKQKIQCLVFF